AAFASSRLARLDDDIARRRAVSRRYRELLAGVDGLEPMFDEVAGEHASHFAFPVLLAGRQERDGFRHALKGRGIQTTWYPAVTELSAYRGLGPLPVAEDAAARHCALPMFASLDEG